MIRKTSNTKKGTGIISRIVSENKQSAKYLQNQILKNWKAKSTLIFYRQYLCDDLADMQLSSTFNKGICFLLRVIDTFSKYDWAVHLKKIKKEL